MPVGPLTDILATFIGAISGAITGKKIPDYIKTALPLTFGAVSMAMGIIMIQKVHALPPVILAMLTGSVAGELLTIESRIEKLAQRMMAPLRRILPTASPTDEAATITQFVSVLVLFSASGTGIFGALNEGMTHDPSVLISKAILDVFTAAIFAAAIGLLVATAVIPQAIILLSLYYLSALILPLTTPALIADFSCCGGIIMFVTGIRICGIKKFPVANMLPALVLVMPISHLWTVLMAH